MKRLLLLFTSLLPGFMLLAQTDTTLVAADSALVQPDTEAVSPTPPKERPKVFQASVNLDYGKLATTLAGWDEKYEAGVSLLFLNQFFILGEYGRATLSPENAFKNGEYTSEGSWYRAGGGYMKQISLKSKLGLGILYARGQFSDRGEGVLTSPSGVQDDYISTFERTGLEARWMEAVIVSENRLTLKKAVPEAPINQLFSLGFYLRARFLVSYDQFESVDAATIQDSDPYMIPGYGSSVNSPNLALNLYLKVYLF